MSTHDDSIYASATPEPRGGGPSSYNYPPQYTRQPSSGSWGCTGFALGGCAAIAALMFCGFLFLSVIIGGMMHVAASFGDLAAESLDDPLRERFVSGNQNAVNKIAILTIEGFITGAEDGFVAKQIRHIMKDEDVKAVVLRIDSPGGTMSGSDYYHYLLKKMKLERNDLPLIVSMGSIAASGGYYIATAGDEIFAERSTITGSIGVIASLYDATELAKKIGIEATPVTSGPHKRMGSFLQSMSDEEKVIWQALIDDNFARFKEVIREGRAVFADDPASLDKLATGQIYTATEAEANHLIDQIGFLDDAVAVAMNRAGLNESNSQAIKYRPKLKFMDVFLESRSPEHILGTKTLQDLTTPRIYLLCPHVLPTQ